MAADSGAAGASLFFIKKLIMLCIFLCLVGILVGLFLSPGLNIPPPLDEAAQKAAAARFSSVMGRGGKQTFSEAEMHYIVNDKLLVLTEEQKIKDKEKLIAEGQPTTLLPDQVYIEFPTPGVVKVTVKTILLDKLPMYTTAYGTLTGGPDGLTFTRNKLQAGRVPIPAIGPIEDHLNWRFLALIVENKRAQSVEEKIKGVVVETGRITLSR